ncbi:MAG: XRE family transcriptional regulator [Clostridia bacterium]|nr:XRE family transcriptional regulator [Clostridia bacterium]
MKSKKSYTDFFQEEVGELEFKTIAEYLEMLLSEKKLQKNEVIARSNLDRNYAYQIFNGRKTNPSRDKMIMLSIGMGLTLEETRKLLKVSSLSDLYIRNPRDSIIMYCLVQKNNLIETNETLSNYGVDILE